MSDRPDGDTFKILVSSDCHLGYAEKVAGRQADTFPQAAPCPSEEMQYFRLQDPIRGDDSFKTFEEMLKLAIEHEGSHCDRASASLCRLG